MVFKRNELTGFLEVWENGKKEGHLITTGDIICNPLLQKKRRIKTNMNGDDFKEFVDRERWTYAVTYANKAPHEYIVRGKINGVDEEFMAAVNYIQEHGITMLYWGHPNKYVFLDGRQYWVMRNGEDDPTTILNRCNCDEYNYAISWKGRKK